MISRSNAGPATGARHAYYAQVPDRLLSPGHADEPTLLAPPEGATVCTGVDVAVCSQEDYRAMMASSHRNDPATDTEVFCPSWSFPPTRRSTRDLGCLNRRS